MDVVAFHPITREFVHIKCSTDAWGWEQKKEVFAKKFKNTAVYYDKIFPFKKEKLQKIAITVFSWPRHNAEKKMDFGSDIKVFLVPNFVVSIASELSKLDPWNYGINESSYPLLRAIQFWTFYLNRELKRKQKLKLE